MKLAKSLCVAMLGIVLMLSGCKSDNVVTGFPVSGELLVSEQYDLPFIPLNSTNYIYVSGDTVMVGEWWTAGYLWCVYSLSDSTKGFKTGYKGRGPNEFTGWPKVFVPTPGDGSFEIYDKDAGKFKDIVFENDKLVIREEKEFLMPDGVSADMLTKINDNIYLSLNNFEDTEFVLTNSLTNEYSKVIKYPKFMSAQAHASGRPVSWVSAINTPVAKPDGTRFAVFYFHYKYFRIFDETGETIKEVSVNIEPYTPHSATTDEDPFIFAYDSVFANDNYIYAICRNGNKSNPNQESELQVWTWNGEPVASYRLDKKVIFGYLTLHDMKLYCFSYLDEDQNEGFINVYDLSHIPYR